MALYQRRESAGRTRFLLALSLSTLTALGVAAPLALQAVQADETLALNDPVAGAYDESGDDDLLGSPGARSLSNDSDSSLGGITQRPAVKGQGQTSKTEPEAPATSPSTDDPALTNPATTPTTAEVEPVETTAVPATTTTAAPTDESSSTTASTTTSSSTTDTTDPDSTTSSSSSTTVGSSSTTDPSTTTTETPGG